VPSLCPELASNLCTLLGTRRDRVPDGSECIRIGPCSRCGSAPKHKVRRALMDAHRNQGATAFPRCCRKMPHVIPSASEPGIQTSSRTRLHPINKDLLLTKIYTLDSTLHRKHMAASRGLARCQHAHMTCGNDGPQRQGADANSLESMPIQVRRRCAVIMWRWRRPCWRRRGRSPQALGTRRIA